MNKLLTLLGVIFLISSCSVLDNNENNQDPFTFKSKDLSFSGYTYLGIEDNSIDVYGIKERNGLSIRIITEGPFKGEGDYNVSIVRLSDGIAPTDGPNIIARGADNSNSLFSINSIEDEIIYASFEGEYTYTFGEKKGKTFFVKAIFELKEGEYIGEIR